jgi:hypothetical protein
MNSNTTTATLHPFKQAVSTFQHAATVVCNVLYGSKERTNLTLAITFGMLVVGITMMQSAANGGACAF